MRGGACGVSCRWGSDHLANPRAPYAPECDACLTRARRRGRDASGRPLGRHNARPEALGFSFDVLDKRLEEARRLLDRGDAGGYSILKTLRAEAEERRLGQVVEPEAQRSRVRVAPKAGVGRHARSSLMV